MKRITIILLSIFGFFVLMSLISFLIPEPDAIAVIPINGIITSSSQGFGSQSVPSGTIVNWIKDAERDSSVKAILFVINSPGGTPVATDEIVSAIRQTTKPTAAVIRDTGASAAYWIASSTDYIIANRMSVVGSIGAIASYLEFDGLLDDFNVTYRRLVTGDYKDVGSPFRQMTPEEQERFQIHLDSLHMMFVEDVASFRNKSLEEVDELADGWIYLGQDAVALGLVDDLGTVDTGVLYFEDMFNKSLALKEYRRVVGFSDILSGSLNVNLNMPEQRTGFRLE